MAERVRRRRFGKDHEPWHKRRRERLGTAAPSGLALDASRAGTGLPLPEIRGLDLPFALQVGDGAATHWVRTSETRILALQCHCRTTLSLTSVESQLVCPAS